MKKKRTRILLIILTVPALALAGAGILFSRIQVNLKALEKIPLMAIDPQTLKDGDYSGSYTAFPISASVRVSIKDGVVTRIELEKHTHGQGAAAESLPGQAVTAQSVQVDLVAGATYSSKVILLAIQDALRRGTP